MIIDKNLLTKALQKVLPIADKGTVSYGVLLEGTDNELHLSATDFTNAIKIKIPATEGQQFRCFVNGKKFYEIAKNLEDNINLEVNGNLFITSNNARFKLHLINDEIPDVMKLTDYDFMLTLNKEDLLQGIDKTVFATGEQDVRYALDNFCIDIKPGEINFTGTDGYRLAMYKISHEIEKEIRILISKKDTKIIKSFISDSELDSIPLYISKEKIMVETEKGFILVRANEQTFPEYRNVIPHYESCIEVNKEDFIKAVKRISTINETKEFKTIILIINSEEKDTLVIKSSNTAEESAIERIESENHIDNITIGINTLYLTEGLEKINSDKVKIYLEKPDRAVYFHDQKYTYVVMPVRLN